MGGGQTACYLSIPMACETQEPLFSPLCWLMTLWQQPTHGLRGGIIRNYRGKQRRWKKCLVRNYLTRFPCFKELLLWQQQLIEDRALRSFRGLAVMCAWRGCISSNTKLCSLHPLFFSTLELEWVLQKAYYLSKQFTNLA